MSLSEGAGERCGRRVRQKITTPHMGEDDWELVPASEARKWHLTEPECVSGAALPYRIPRNATMLDIFLLVFTPQLYDSLKQALGVEISLRRFYEVTAIRVFIQFMSTPPRRGTIEAPLRTSLNAALDAFKAEGIIAISHNTFARDFGRLYFPPEWIRQNLTTALDELVQYGSFLVLDEKLKKYTGASPCTRTILTKPDKVGHWVSQVCVYLAADIVYCTRLYPVTAPTDGTTNRTSDLVEWATVGAPVLSNGKKPTMIADSFYLDAAGLQFLQQSQIPFVCALSSVRFPGLFRMAERELHRTESKNLKWIAFKNTANNLRFVYRQTDASRTPKIVISNAFTNGASRGAAYIPIWDEYGYAASACDEFNKQLAGRYWPFRRMGWMKGIDDLAFTASLIDIFNLYRSTTQQGSYNTQLAMRDLAFSLYKHAQTLSY